LFILNPKKLSGLFNSTSINFQNFPGLSTLFFMTFQVLENQEKNRKFFQDMGMLLNW